MRTTAKSARQESGFATVAVIILLMAASAFVGTTALTFRNLHRELRFLEKQQLHRWHAISLSSTNRVSVPNSATNAAPANP